MESRKQIFYKVKMSCLFDNTKQPTKFQLWKTYGTILLITHSPLAEKIIRKMYDKKLSK